MAAKIPPPSFSPKPTLIQDKPFFFNKTQTAPPHSVALRPRPLLKATGPITNSSTGVGPDGEGSSDAAASKDAANSSSESSNGIGGGSTTRSRQPLGSTLNIRYRSISRKQARRQQDVRMSPPPPPPPKEWEEMTLGEKAVEFYVGEKGLLFWLNKFAYASIFIIIGGWILFRFVGPSLGLYQLDTPPLAPTAIFKG